MSESPAKPTGGDGPGMAALPVAAETGTDPANLPLLEAIAALADRLPTPSLLNHLDVAFHRARLTVLSADAAALHPVARAGMLCAFSSGGLAPLWAAQHAVGPGCRTVTVTGWGLLDLALAVDRGITLDPDQPGGGDISAAHVRVLLERVRFEGEPALDSANRSLVEAGSSLTGGGAAARRAFENRLLTSRLYVAEYDTAQQGRELLTMRTDGERAALLFTTAARATCWLRLACADLDAGRLALTTVHAREFLHGSVQHGHGAVLDRYSESEQRFTVADLDSVLTA